MEVLFLICPHCRIAPYFWTLPEGLGMDRVRMANQPPITGQLSIDAQDGSMVDHRSPPEMKIALFRALFRGRADVYPRRFESRKSGKAGYQPACANEWVKGICEKPRVKCSDCRHQRFRAVTDEAIRWHLSGHVKPGLPM